MRRCAGEGDLRGRRVAGERVLKGLFALLLGGAAGEPLVLERFDLVLEFLDSLSLKDPRVEPRSDVRSGEPDMVKELCGMLFGCRVMGVEGEELRGSGGSYRRKEARGARSGGTRCFVESQPARGSDSEACVGRFAIRYLSTYLGRKDWQ